MITFTEELQQAVQEANQQPIRLVDPKWMFTTNSIHGEIANEQLR